MIKHLPELITDKAKILQQAGIDQAKAEVESILCHLLDTDRMHLYLDGSRLLSNSTLTELDRIIQQRASRYPLQYILGEAWFYGRKFYVSPTVMVPTPETEVLCETALGFVREKQMSKPRILDLGVGAGVIAVTLAGELPDCTVLGVDISQPAIEVAQRNARELRVVDKIEFRQSDFFTSVAERERFDLIVSNPPYVSEKEYPTLPPEVLAEPQIALLAGQNGMDAIKIIVREAPKYLARGGRIMLEIGHRQAAAITKMTEKDDRYTSIAIIKDLNDIDRVVILSCSE